MRVAYSDRVSEQRRRSYAPVAAPPGGPLLGVAKQLLEQTLWTRVGLQRRWESRRGRTRSVPTTVAPTGVLRSRAQWQAAAAEARSLGLPLHHDRPKNWDALGAVAAVLGLAEGEERAGLRVLDAGAARYSPVLPWLRLYGLGEPPGALLGINLEFGRERRHDGVVFRFGDATATGLPSGSCDALTCMSVIEHGIPVEEFFAEAGRVVRSGGLLCVSTDYDEDPPDTTGITAYGSPVRIFGPAGVRGLVAAAEAAGFSLVGDLDDGALAHEERPVHWRRTGLDYTFILLTFRRR